MNECFNFLSSSCTIVRVSMAKIVFLKNPLHKRRRDHSHSFAHFFLTNQTQSRFEAKRVILIHTFNFPFFATNISPKDRLVKVVHDCL